METQIRSPAHLWDVCALDVLINEEQNICENKRRKKPRKTKFQSRVLLFLPEMKRCDRMQKVSRRENAAMEAKPREDRRDGGTSLMTEG